MADTRVPPGGIDSLPPCTADLAVTTALLLVDRDGLLVIHGRGGFNRAGAVRDHPMVPLHLPE